MICRYLIRASSIALLALAVILGTVLLAGCGATRQTDLWSDPTYKAGPVKKIMVVAIRKDQLRRRMWEDAMVNALQSKTDNGTITVASYQLYPVNIPDTTEVVRTARSEGYDGVLVVARVELDSLTNQIPGYMAREQVTSYNRRWGSYVTRWEDVYHEGYSETETTLSVRVDLLLSQDDGKLVWSVTSMTVDPTSAEDFRSSVADRVASQLKKNQYIQ